MEKNVVEWKYDQFFLDPNPTDAFEGGQILLYKTCVM